MDFQLNQLPVTLACHPSANLAAVGCIDGNVSLLSYDASTSQTEPSFEPIFESWKKQHKTPVRKIRFSLHGDQIFSLTRNKTLTIWQTETGKKFRVVRNISSQGARPYCMQVLSEHQFAIGDEMGVAKVFDWRCPDNPPCIAEMIDSETDQYLTDMTCDQSGRTLLATCGDCTLVAFDVRKKKAIVKSEPMHDELLCVVGAKNETKLFCGSSDGYLEEFNWGEWGNLVERVKTRHKEAVDCLVKLDEDLLVTGSSDGTIRLHHILPNKMLKILGSHDDDSPVEELAIGQTNGNNAKWLLSCGHDNKVKFWDAEKLRHSAPRTKSGSKLKKITKKSSHLKNPDFFDDLVVKSEEKITESSGEDEESDSD